MLESIIVYRNEKFAKKVFAQALAKCEDIWGEYFSKHNLVFFPCTGVFFQNQIGISEHEHKLNSSNYPIFYLHNSIYTDIFKLLSHFPADLKKDRENLTLFFSIAVFHEYAHHIQTLLWMFRKPFGTEQKILFSRLQEAQADFFTGVCLKHLEIKLDKEDFTRAAIIFESSGYHLGDSFLKQDTVIGRRDAGVLRQVSVVVLLNRVWTITF